MFYTYIYGSASNLLMNEIIVYYSVCLYMVDIKYVSLTLREGHTIFAYFGMIEQKMKKRPCYSSVYS